MNETSNLPIRDGLRSVLLHFWKDTFDDLHGILRITDSIHDYIGMDACGQMSNQAEPCTPIHRGTHLAHNVQIATTEILDDFWAAYLCFLNGFTKQSQQLLRNTIELIVQILYMDHSERSGKPIRDNWVAGTRGIEHVADKIKAMKPLLQAIKPGLAAKLHKMYDKTCMSAHAHKERMSARNRIFNSMSPDRPVFEPIDIIYTRAVFFSVLELTTYLLKWHFESRPGDYWREQIIVTFKGVLDGVAKYETVIKNFELGYLIHREYLILADGFQVEYSIKLNGKSEAPGRRKRMVTPKQSRELGEKLEERLLLDKT